MKNLIIILILIGLGLIVFNVTKLDFEDPFTGDSAVAAIGVLAAACAVLIMLILWFSLKVKRRK